LDDTVKDIQGYIESLNTSINQIQYDLLKSDDNMAQISQSCRQFVNQNHAILETQDLKSQLQKLTSLHQSLQHKLYTQSLENKNLRSSNLENSKSKEIQLDQKYMQTYAIDNLEKLLKESRDENSYLVGRIDDLQKQVSSGKAELESSQKTEQKWLGNAEKIMD
jgi:chromosome segregation ATPase